jgi:cystathionine beta-lyase
LAEKPPRKPSLRPATRLVEAGRHKDWTSVPGLPGGVVNPPIWRASTHVYENSADLAGGRPNRDGHFFYGRRGAPTQWALADALTEMEPGADGTVLFCSGVAAISTALMAVLRPGDVLLVTDNAYEPTRNIALGMLQEWGVETRPFDPLDLEALRALFCERTKAVMIESPGSLTMEVCDVPAIAAMARAHGAVSLLDNTWAGPLNFPALQHGCDIAIMSLTKHVGGHSDVMLGSVACGEALYPKIRRTSQLLGHNVSPDDAALCLRGLRTLDLRLERETESALKIAQWLETRPEVSAVLCPMLPGFSGYDLWKRDFAGGCGLFSFVFKGGSVGDRARFVDALELFAIGFSWGGFESLIVPFDPSKMRSISPWPLPGLGEDDRMAVRLSIGLEDPDDLIADLEAGFRAMERK